MKEMKAVIGKNFGDEGKGQLVNDLCREAIQKGNNVLVIRHNGGAQAGHTVEEKDFRFVFHQLGSGSRQGASTFWSHTFLPDLLKLGEEAKEFMQKMYTGGIKMPEVRIFADDDCSCVTVYDVLLNSFAEDMRGSCRHGSCGMGIYEAQLRSRRKEDTICLKALQGASPAQVTKLLRQIRDGYVYRRVEELCIELKQAHPETLSQERKQENEWLMLIKDEQLLQNAAELMWENFNRYVTVADFKELVEDTDSVIFENAQGLLLDMDNEEYYPHLTPSHTGLLNIAGLLQENGFLPDAGTRKKNRLAVPEPEIWYVSRTYITRHGFGRLDYECAKEEINPDIKDLTNVRNHWQEELRFARHPSIGEFLAPMQKDLNLFFSHADIPVKVILYFTHLDETDGKILMNNRELTVEELEKTLTQENNFLINKVDGQASLEVRWKTNYNKSR